MRGGRRRDCKRGARALSATFLLFRRSMASKTIAVEPAGVRRAGGEARGGDVETQPCQRRCTAALPTSAAHAQFSCLLMW